MPPKKKFGLTVRQKHWLFGLLATLGTFIVSKLPEVRDLICRDERPVPAIVPIRKMPEQPPPNAILPPCPAPLEPVKGVCYARLEMKPPCGDFYDGPDGASCFAFMTKKPRASSIEDAQ